MGRNLHVKLVLSGLIGGLALEPAYVLSQPSGTPESIQGAPLPSFSAPAGRGDLWSGIVNGTITDRHPSVAALLRLEDDGRAQQKGHCSGTLVGCRYILTAAHCITEPDPPTSYVAW